MERDDPEALKRVAQAAIARAASAMSPRKLAAASAAAAAAIRRDPLGLEIPGTSPDHRLAGEQLSGQWPRHDGFWTLLCRRCTLLHPTNLLMKIISCYDIHGRQRPIPSSFGQQAAGGCRMLWSATGY
jgi:hypothetical protein